MASLFSLRACGIWIGSGSFWSHGSCRSCWTADRDSPMSKACCSGSSRRFCCCRRFLEYTDPGGRRRSAMLATTGGIVGLGILLDCVFGQRILQFDESPQAQYIGWFTIARFGVHVPYEEFLFYAMAPIAILLVYGWASEVLARGLHAAVHGGRDLRSGRLGVRARGRAGDRDCSSPASWSSATTPRAQGRCPRTTRFSWCSR